MEYNERTNKNQFAAWIERVYNERVSPWFDTFAECKEYCKNKGIEYDFISPLN